MITYNHKRYLAQAIDSILMQTVNFDYEVVIGEDCSTDSTREVAIGFQRRFPDRIHLELRERNLGVITNFVKTLQACQGQYIALLEGDDYWVSDHKLQKQVDFLDDYPECAICFHNATNVYEDSNQEPHNCVPADQKEISTLKDLLVSNFIPTCSVMFRRSLFSEFPDWYHLLEMGDWPLHMLNAQHGKIGYINEVMAAHRVHSRGIWSKTSTIQHLQQIIRMYEYINGHWGHRYERIIRTSVSRHRFLLAVAYANGGDIASARTNLIRSIRECPLNGQIGFADLSAMVLRLYAPGLHKALRNFWLSA